MPDITNNQVQINTLAPALSPVEVEKQVTFPVETALAGIKGLRSTRSLSRNGFSQVVAIFHDDVDIYFARQQVLERLSEARELLPEGVEPRMGPISTGLGEIYMWTVDWAPRRDGDTARDGRPGWQADGSYLTPEGQRLANGAGAHGLPPHLAGLGDPAAAPQRAGRRRRGRHRRLREAVPRPARPGAADRPRPVLRATWPRRWSATTPAAAPATSSAAARATWCAPAAGWRRMEDIRNVVVATREGVPVRVRDVARVAVGQELRTGSASARRRRRWWSAPR